MKKSTHFLAVVIVFIFAISCKNTTEKKQVKEQPQQTEELQLNNGKLWEANAETSEGINAMLELMANFSDDENPEAYATLKQNLETQFKTIIQKCTMTGEAHDQLHVFIVPMKDLFNGLTSSDSVNSKEYFNRLDAHLKTYKNYFE